MPIFKFKKNVGFTLIELLVTISIVAVLATIGATIFTGTQNKAKDSARKADIVAIAKALEANYSPVSGIYDTSKITNGTAFASGSVPTPPEGGDYFVDLTADGKGFRTCAVLSDSTPFCVDSEQGVYTENPPISPFLLGTPPGAPTPTSGPTATSGPTNTPTPTLPGPTNTPTPTSAPTATPTNTPVPTAVPTNTPTPTAAATQNLGNTAIGATSLFRPQNVINGSKFTMPNNGGNTISMTVYIVSPINPPPNDKYQMAIYADNAGSPGARIGVTSQGTATGNAWNTLPITTLPALSANTIYWLVYNTNANGTNYDNTIKYNTGAAGSSAFRSQGFGNMTDPFGVATLGTAGYSIYVTYTPI